MKVAVTFHFSSGATFGVDLPESQAGRIVDGIALSWHGSGPSVTQMSGPDETVDINNAAVVMITRRPLKDSADG